MTVPVSTDTHPQPWQRLSRAMPWLVLTVSLLVTMQLWQGAKQDARHNLQTLFDAMAREISGDIGQRMSVYEQVLRGAQGLFSASRSVGREAFRIYVEHQRLEQNYPGIQGLGFALIVPPTQKDAHIAAIRRENLHTDRPVYSIKPEGKRGFYTSVVYLEPFNWRNRRAYGYDMYSDRESPREGDSAPGLRRAAMERARDSGEAAISGKVRLLMENDRDIQTGFLMYLPVYRKDATHDTVAERRANIIGWVYAPFRADDLMGGLLGEHATDLDFEIYDGEEMSAKTLMHDSARDFANGRGDGHSSDFQSVRHIEIADRYWTVQIRSRAGFEAQLDTYKQRFIAIGGAVASLFLALLTWLLTRGRERAVLAARKMNKELLRSEDHARRIGLLYKMLSETNSANIHIRERDRLFETACRIAVESGLFRMAWIGLLDPKCGDIVPVGQAGHVDGYLDGHGINIYRDETGDNPTCTAIKSGIFVACNDIESDPRMASWRDAALKRGYRASIVYPLTQSGQVIGAFSLYFGDARSLTDDLIQLLGSLVEDISFTLDFIAESARREQAQNELRELSVFLQSALENERRRIARELHDELGQTMTALHFDLKWLHENIDTRQREILKRLRSMQDLLGRTVDTVRRISEDLRPGMLDDLGLAAAIEHHAAKFAAQTGIVCDLAMNPAEFVLDDPVATALFRIVQESLTNVARHSGASRVTIRLQELGGNILGDKILLIVQDDGRGLPISRGNDKKTYGLLGMRERVKMLGGTLDIFNEAGAGVRIEACIPKFPTILEYATTRALP